MKDLESGELKIVVKEGPPTVIEWTGMSNARAPASIINPFVDNLIDEFKNKETTIDFRKLEYMNSSTVTPIIRLMKMFDDNSIKTLVIYDRSSKWQQASFKALDTLARMLNYIEVKGQ
ncbi:MAG: hypothetical protein GY847_04915 [Proteobacteria bacterium]|nr:hypothetical protein [Pseudomonadota bacterium]